MDLLRTAFPLAFQYKKDTTALVINVIIHAVVDLLAGIVIGFLGILPLVGIFFTALGGLVGLYFTISLVLSLLDYFRILK